VRMYVYAVGEANIVGNMRMLYAACLRINEYLQYVH
jgi:hypothetical protein